ncbi:MAG: hypothetical protein WC449_04740 [Candidatus Paceibacterota bacterium]
MDYEDILKIICDSLHYPEFAKAKELCQQFENILQSVYNEGYEELTEESESAFDDGYEEGKAYGKELGLKNALEIVVEKEAVFDALDAFDEVISAIEDRIEYVKNEQDNES